MYHVYQIKSVQKHVSGENKLLENVNLELYRGEYYDI